MAKPIDYATAQKLFLATLLKHIFDNNEFIKFSRNWNKYAKGARVEWNESGGGTKSRRNGSRGAAKKRTDVKRGYDIEKFGTDPTILEWVEEIIISYKKRYSILEEHLEEIREDIVMYILYCWVKGSDTVIDTTGDEKLGIDGEASLAVTPDEFLEAQSLMDKQKVPDDGNRVALVPADMMKDLRKHKSFQSRDTYPGMVLVNGAIGKIANFNIVKRANTLLFDASGEPIVKDEDATDAPAVQAGDARTITLWHPRFVTRSISKASKVSLIDTHEGLELSTTSIAGGDVLYKNGRGVITIREKKKPTG